VNRLPAFAAGAALALVATPAAAWQTQVGESGLREAYADGVAAFTDRETAARLRLRCQPGGAGRLSWVLEIDGTRGFGFDFEPFNGPDAPAVAARLGQVAVAGGLIQPRVTPVMAGYHDGADRFVLEFSAPATTASDAALLADSIGPQSTTLAWRLADFTARDRVLEARFDLAGAAAATASTMLGCGPAPTITAAQRDAWRGRNPLGLEWFAQRPVRWHLHALLGARHDAVLARLGMPEPVGVDDDTVFVLAPDATSPRSGVAILLRGADAELVLVDDGRVERLASSPGAIPLPAAVREFVAARSGTP
jgi:hypothetical protein